jgi:hypothetical protein
VLQDLQLLLAVNAFDAAHRAEFRARIDADIPEIVGLIQCKLEQQEQQAEEEGGECVIIAMTT